MKQPKRLMAQAIEQAALNGVARAIDARKAAGVELSADDVNQISGGLTLPKLTLAGPYPIDILKAPTLASQVSVAANVANGGLVAPAAIATVG